MDTPDGATFKTRIKASLVILHLCSVLQTIVMTVDVCCKYSIVECTWLVAMYYHLVTDYKTVLTKFAARYLQTPVLQCKCLKLKFEANNCLENG